MPIDERRRHDHGRSRFRPVKLAGLAASLGLIAAATVWWSGTVLDLPQATPLTTEQAEARSGPPPAALAARVAPGPRPERFAVELETLFTNGDATRVERRLNEGGFQTVRFRQDVRGSSGYTVVAGRLPSRREAEAVLATLREAGLEGAVLEADGALSVRVDATLALRGAVRLAERLRGRGRDVRVVTAPGAAAMFVLRHGNFSSRQEAEQAGRVLERLGLPNRVVQLR